MGDIRLDDGYHDANVSLILMLFAPHFLTHSAVFLHVKTSRYVLVITYAMEIPRPSMLHICRMRTVCQSLRIKKQFECARSAEMHRFVLKPTH